MNCSYLPMPPDSLQERIIFHVRKPFHPALAAVEVDEHSLLRSALLASNQDP